jgi:hypothetical protein
MFLQKSGEVGSDDRKQNIFDYSQILLYRYKNSFYLRNLQTDKDKRITCLGECKYIYYSTFLTFFIGRDTIVVYDSLEQTVRVVDPVKDVILNTFTIDVRKDEATYAIDTLPKEKTFKSVRISPNKKNNKFYDFSRSVDGYDVLNIEKLVFMGEKHEVSDPEDEDDNKQRIRVLDLKTGEMKDIYLKQDTAMTGLKTFDDKYTFTYSENYDFMFIHNIETGDYQTIKIHTDNIITSLIFPSGNPGVICVAAEASHFIEIIERILARIDFK